MKERARRPAGGLLVALVAGLSLLAAGCLDLPERAPHGPAPGAEAITVRAADDRPMDGRLWVRDTTRLVIYLHEFNRTQRDWWAEASRGAPSEPSTLALDLRGHGDSSGDADDFELMAQDVQTVIAYARARGYQQIAIVGAGMGGTIAILVARTEPRITVVGLSVPVDFGSLDVREAAREMAPRLAIVASREDLSARESLEQIALHAGLDTSRAVLLPGRAHGRALLHGSSEGATRRLIQDSLTRAWQ